MLSGMARPLEEAALALGRLMTLKGITTSAHRRPIQPGSSAASACTRPSISANVRSVLRMEKFHIAVEGWH
jgi:hypothetical protein